MNAPMPNDRLTEIQDHAKQMDPGLYPWNFVNELLGEVDRLREETSLAEVLNECAVSSKRFLAKAMSCLIVGGGIGQACWYLLPSPWYIPATVLCSVLAGWGIALFWDRHYALAEDSNA